MAAKKRKRKNPSGLVIGLIVVGVAVVGGIALVAMTGSKSPTKPKTGSKSPTNPKPTRTKTPLSSPPYTAQQICTRYIELADKWQAAGQRRHMFADMQDCMVAFADVERKWLVMTDAQRNATVSLMNCAMNKNVTQESLERCEDTWIAVGW